MSVRTMLATVDEPATLITDWILAACTAWWAGALMLDGLARGADGLATLSWGVGFAATAIAAAAGGWVHGFQRRYPAAGRALWRVTVHAIAVASAAMLAAAALGLHAPSLQPAVLAVALVKLIIVTRLLVRRPLFGIALADHAAALLVVLGLQWWGWWTYGARSAPWIAAGIALAAVAAAIQVLRLAPHPRFNHNDLYHVIQLGALWLLYRGGMLLGIS